MGCGSSTGVVGGGWGDPPESPEGKERLAKAKLSFEALSRTLRVAEAARLMDIISASEFAKDLSASGPMRSYDAGWCTILFPDNGLWTASVTPPHGILSVQCVKGVMPVKLTMSMAPMKSEVDSKGYTDMFTANIDK
jgi:hypothetical protein